MKQWAGGPQGQRGLACVLIPHPEAAATFGVRVCLEGVWGEMLRSQGAEFCRPLEQRTEEDLSHPSLSGRTTPSSAPWLVSSELLALLLMVESRVEHRRLLRKKDFSSSHLGFTVGLSRHRCPEPWIPLVPGEGKSAADPSVTIRVFPSICRLSMELLSFERVIRFRSCWSPIPKSQCPPAVPKPPQPTRRAKSSSKTPGMSCSWSHMAVHSISNDRTGPRQQCWGGHAGCGDEPGPDGKTQPQTLVAVSLGASDPLPVGILVL